jgi:hypothetical protein
MDTDYRDREVDEYNVECRECGNAYDTDSWTIAIPRDLAEEIIDAAQVISGKKRCSAKVATPKSRTILTQFSETKNRSELCLQEYDDNDAQGVGYPIHESMEKLL